jgi:hypothetical protein
MGCNGKIIAMRMPIKATIMRISDDSLFNPAIMPISLAAIHSPL